MAAYVWNGKDHNMEFTADALIDFIIWVRRRAWGLSGHKWGARLLYEQYYMLTFMVKFYTKKIGEEKIHCMELNLISLNAEVNFKYIFNLRNWQKKEIKSWH